jgi:hypothetical protein
VRGGAREHGIEEAVGLFSAAADLAITSVRLLRRKYRTFQGKARTSEMG